MYNIENQKVSIKIKNKQNGKQKEFYLPVSEDTLKKELDINSYHDKNLILLSTGRGGGMDLKIFLDYNIKQKNITIKELNAIGEIFDKYGLEEAITINAFIDAKIIKKWEDIIEKNKELDRYCVLYYHDLQKEALGNFLYNTFQHRKPIYERSKEYKEKLVDQFHKVSKGEFTRLGYLVKDFNKIKAKCTNRGFELIEKTKNNECEV